jgi:hypothetical protein
MRPGTRPAGSTNRRGRPRRWWARSTVDQAAGAGHPGGGWAASPSAPSKRRTASGSVTGPTIRRGPAQRGQTRTSIANTRRRRRAQGHRLEDRPPASARAPFAAGGTIADLQRARGASRIRCKPSLQDFYQRCEQKLQPTGRFQKYDSARTTRCCRS